MKRMAVLTSEGNAPGMNATIRSVVLIEIEKGWQTLDVRHGYSGLITDNVCRWVVGLVKGEIAATPLDEVTANKKPLNLHLLKLA